MHGRWAIGNEKLLRRVMALLVALATLAEKAAARSVPVRLFLLWILRRAEATALEYVVETAGMPPALGAIAAPGHSPADAHRLAARFRALAAALGALLPGLGRRDWRSARRGVVFDQAPGGSGCAVGGRTGKPHDTS